MHKRPSHLESCLPVVRQRRVAKPHITRRRARFAKTQPMSCTPLSRLKNRPADRDSAKPPLASFVTNLTNPYQNGGRGEKASRTESRSTSPFFSPTNERRGGWGVEGAGIAIGGGGPFPSFLSLFFFFSWRSLGRRRRHRRKPAQTRADKGDPEQSACSQVSRLGGYIAHWQRKRAVRLRLSGACACVDLRWDSGCFWWIREDWVFDSALIRKGVGTAGGGFRIWEIRPMEN